MKKYILAALAVVLLAVVAFASIHPYNPMAGATTTSSTSPPVVSNSSPEFVNPGPPVTIKIERPVGSGQWWDRLSTTSDGETDEYVYTRAGAIVGSSWKLVFKGDGTYYVNFKSPDPKTGQTVSNVVESGSYTSP